MSTTSEPTIRELDRRDIDGIDVRLLWNARTDRVSIVVEDQRHGASLTFEVDGAAALAAFRYPHAYSSNLRSARAATQGTAVAPQPDLTSRRSQC